MKTFRPRSALAAAVTLSVLTALAGCGVHDGWLPVPALTAAVQHALARGR